MKNKCKAEKDWQDGLVATSKIKYYRTTSHGFIGSRLKSVLWRI